MDKRDLVRLSIVGGIVLALLILTKHHPTEEQTAAGEQPTAQPSVVYAPVPVQQAQQTSSLAQQLLFDNGPAIAPQPNAAPPTQPVYPSPPQSIDAQLSDQSTQAVKIPQVTVPSVDWQSDTPTSTGTLNAQTGAFYPSVPGGSVDPQTGAFYPSVPGGGTIDPQTGTYNPGTGG
jgi:hypothetical protein